VLRCGELHKAFGGHRVLQGFSWDFQSGLTAVVGLNGSGKSTLLNLISGFSVPDSGTASWNGTTITGLHPTKIARRGVVRSFQDDRAAGELTVGQHVGLGIMCDAGRTLASALAGVLIPRPEATAEAMKVVRGVLDRLGISELSAHRVRSLSIGQRRLVGLATCIATGASCFLLDEPFAGVDPNHSHLIMKALRALANQAKTVLFVEHDLGRVAELQASAVEIRSGCAHALESYEPHGF
jgi:ABC-type branched-subunit amino acid transport system ATPase component